MKLDNHEVAIVTKLNALAERHGIKPYEFSAMVGYNSKTENTELEFVMVDDHVVKKMDAMLDAIAGKDGIRSGLFAGTPKEIIDALDGALAKAPRSRIG